MSRTMKVHCWLACLLFLSSSSQNDYNRKVSAFVAPSLPLKVSKPRRRSRVNSVELIRWQTKVRKEEDMLPRPIDSFIYSNPLQFLFEKEEGSDEIKLFAIIRSTFAKLAELSLEDYKWRSSVFKSNEADRRVEESVARMMGEDPSYVRPMDAAEEKIGPLGRAEKNAVSWLSKVIEEEGRRAERIANSEGSLVRPIDLTRDEDTSGSIEIGPLAFLEKQAVEFINRIRDSEKERVETRTLRPKDVEEAKRGPLGNAEAKAVSALSEIQQAEKLRVEQSRLRGGQVVRPIDVPGPLGEIEKKILDIFDAERERKKDRERNEGRLVRPKDATIQGPLGTAEKQAMTAVEQLQDEERERLRNIQRVMEENRPMALDRLSPLGIVEAIIVGVLRAPQLLISVIQRVQELLSSEPLNAQDEEILKNDEEEQFRLRLPNNDSVEPFQ